MRLMTQMGTSLVKERCPPGATFGRVRERAPQELLQRQTLCSRRVAKTRDHTGREIPYEDLRHCTVLGK